MARQALPYLLAALLAGAPAQPRAAGAARAGEEFIVAAARKPVGADSMRQAGILYLADLGDEYLVMGDLTALERLEASGVPSRRVLGLGGGDAIYLLTAPDFRSEMLYSGAFTELGCGRYLAAVEPRGGGVTGGPWPEMAGRRLFPRVFPAGQRREFRGPPDAMIPDPDIERLVERVSEQSIYGFISELSGHQPVVIGGVPDTLRTRYSYSPELDRAAEYLSERMQAFGLEVDYHHYAVSTYDLYALDCVSAGCAWVAGREGRVLFTGDGGAAWVSRDPGAPGLSFNGVCFLDTLTGWASATGGRVYHTLDGGASWDEQVTPTTVTLRDICFIDSLQGWVAGYAGVTMRTLDGGLTWTAVPSGVATDLYGLHFEGPSRGWACGKGGTLLFWDGAAWSPRESGTGQYLMDICFVDGFTGYAAGHGGTILKTVDGGSAWTELSAPPESNPYLQGVCFADSLRGWAVGLGGTVLHTADAGASWSEQPTYTLFGLRGVDFADTLKGWAAGYGGTILRTDDGGATWRNQRRNLPPEAIISLKSVVGTRQGTVSDEQVVICGHFDSISEDPMNLAPGADDNASGTAAVLEAARVLGPCPFEKTIKFLCFSGEEQGLYGSGEYAADARMRGDRIVGVLNFDMIGYEDAAPEDIDVIGNPASEWLVDFALGCGEAYVPGLPALKIIDPAYVLSDHSPFWNAGYDALLGIEDSEVPYPYYHTVNDTLGNLSVSFAADVTRMGLAAVAELAVPDSAASGAGEGGVAAPGPSAYPNPFGGSVVISFSLAAGGRVEAGIFDVEGRLVRALLERRLPAGLHHLTWDGRDSGGRRVSPGIYFTRIRTEVGTLSSKVIALR